MNICDYSRKQYINYVKQKSREREKKKLVVAKLISIFTCNSPNREYTFNSANCFTIINGGTYREIENMNITECGKNKDQVKIIH